MNTNVARKTEWDYSDLAATYDKRPEYSPTGLARVFENMSLDRSVPVADIGAGTAKLSKPLAEAGFRVLAVEPNDNMRTFGMANTRGLPVAWHVGTAEQTGLPDTAVSAGFFGSSFNVVDQLATLDECRRILRPGGWFCCMWNHRDLDDPLQRRIETIIRSHIVGYDYGLRRESPEAVIRSHGAYQDIRSIESGFRIDMSRLDIVEAWKSHATLARQAGDAFNTIIMQIAAALPPQGMIPVPYTTRIWCARLVE